MFKRNYIIKIKDGYFEYINTEKKIFSKKFYFPYKIYKDGRILDYHHFFYKFKKMIENLNLDNYSNLILLIESSEFLHFNLNIPKINEDEIMNYLKINITDYINEEIKNFKIFYDSIYIDDSIALSIDLVNKEFINTLEQILKKIEIKNYEFFPINHIIHTNGIFLEIGTNYINKITVKNHLVYKSEKIYNKNLENLIADSNLETKNVENILNRKYDPELNNLDEDFVFKYTNYFLNNISFFQSYENEEKNIFILGSLNESTPVLKLQEFIAIPLKDGNNLEKYDVFIKKPKRKIVFNKEKIFNYILPIIIFSIFLINILYIKNLNSQINELTKLESIYITTEDDNSSDKFQQNNKKFMNLVIEIQKLEDSNFFVTDYLFDKGDILINGVVKDENYLRNKLKGFKIINKNIFNEDGFYKFEIKLKN